jgi:CBS domain-containing protein
MMRGGFHGYTVHVTAQLIGTLAALVYALVAGVIIFAIVDLVTGLRVTAAEEVEGLDVAEHGMLAYPEFSLPRASGGALHVLSAVRVGEVMTEVPAISPQDTLDSVQETMFACEVFALPVLDEDAELCGIVTMSDVTKIARPERGSVRVAAVYSREVQSAYPDQTIHEVVERMRSRHIANVPVVSRREEKKLLGMITKTDIIMAYRRVAVESAVGGD